MSEHIASTHIVSKGSYYLVFAALIVLTVITYVVSLFDFATVSPSLWWLNTLIALLIAATKASLVVLLFMHVRYASRLTRLIVVAGFFWLAIMLVFIGTDYSTRPKEVNKRMETTVKQER
ncbi:MAG: cytochrome C oxidase subunit IV family protein [Pyrinomonadaceae bacterium]